MQPPPLQRGRGGPEDGSPDNASASCPPRLARQSAWVGIYACVIVAGCSPAPPGAIGAPCSADVDCESDFCVRNPWKNTKFACQDPKSDDDEDGLRWVEERIAGTDPTERDTDGDGIDDPTEVGNNPGVPVDTDSDGKADAIESSKKDADNDCLVDQEDPDDGAKADGKTLAELVCTVGVCKGKATTATCDAATSKVSCTVSTGVPFEPKGESLCDGLDNDCDGQTDENLEGKAGLLCGEFGVCAGSNTSRCVGGTWSCNLAKLPDYQDVEDRCDALDNDCDGQTDEAPICKDDLDCTVDSCDGAAKSCIHKPENKACNDGNPCTVNLCDPAGGCKTLARIGTCDDGDPCTVGESCKDGKCVGATAAICDDGNPCTANPCNAQSGCLAIALSDGITCKPDELCFQTGTCKTGKCLGADPVDCEDGNSCTKDTCNSKSGSCQHVSVTGLCDDGIACTVGDTCVDKLCKGTPQGTAQNPCCTKHSQCDDKNPCSEDICKNGACQNDATALNDEVCDDGNKCTLKETCTSGVCAANAIETCDDTDACTLDSCGASSGCGHVQLPDGAKCDDGDVCNGTSLCQKGVCKAGNALDCADNNPCTKDSCNSTKGCQNTAHQGDCDDGNSCTVGDTCQSGGCEGKVLTCNDDNPCTVNTCEIAKGCVYKPISGNASCDDGDPCTLDDTCQAGTCTGKPKSCDDNKPCSIDSCDKGSGCVHDFKSTESTACDDGNACTLGDTCKLGQCTSGALITCNDSNVCTEDVCDKVSGVCKYTFNTKPCTPVSGCVVNAACDQGVCKGTAKADCCADFQQCKDGDSCTVDTCGDGGKCEYSLVSGTSCDDGNKCTTGDKCSSGRCISGASVGCNDNKACTIDYCLPGSGCQHLLKVSGTCPDDDLCNGEETCDKTGACKPAASPLSCDDANPCTLDLCKPKVGCANTYEPPGEPCDDGSDCTSTDKCDGVGNCKGTVAKTAGCCASSADCDDKFACTTDTCDTKTSKCKQVPLTCSGASCKWGWCNGGTCTQDDVCNEPVVYSQGFDSATVHGWWMFAVEAKPGAGFGWAQATDGNDKTLHCGYGNGQYIAAMPPISLGAGTWTLTFSLRLDVDSEDCTKGALVVRRDGVELAKFCKTSQTLVTQSVTVTVAATAPNVGVEFVFNPVSGKPDSKRGVWLDNVQVKAGSPTSSCSCAKP